MQEIYTPKIYEVYHNYFMENNQIGFFNVNEVLNLPQEQKLNQNDGDEDEVDDDGS